MTDAEATAKLEGLRKRPRSPVKEGLVRAVMVQAGSFEDKIRRIEMIDLMPEPAPAPAKKAKKAKGALLRPPKADPVPETAPDPGLAEAKRVEHYRRRLGQVPVRGGFWAYLTKEFGALVRFGARTSTLSRGLIPFTLRLSPESVAFLGRTLPDQVLPVLVQTLPILLRKSWLHLTKFEYNLLAGLADLVRVTGGIRVPEGDRLAGGPVWDAVLPGIRLFRTAPDLLARLLGAWETATSRLGTSEAVRQSGTESIRTLLMERTDALSFPDVLLALLMLRSRRQLTWEDQPAEPGEYFLKDAFDCTPEVQAEIDKAAGILTDQLEVLIRESQEIRRIRYFLPAEDLLKDFDGGAGRENKTEWARAFLPLLDASFSPLLEGQVVFADNTQTQLFQNPSLSSTLARLRLLETQLSDPLLAANPELTASVAKVVMNLGKTLVVLIRNRSMTADPLARAPSTEQLTDPLPFEQSVIDRPPAWAGLTVIDTLVKAARVGIQAGRLLGETSLEASLEKEGTLEGRAQEILARLGRLVPTARIEGLRDRWNAEGRLEQTASPG